MPLTPEEEKKLREEVRRKLEEREKKYRTLKEQEEAQRRRQLEERLRLKIKEEEEEKFYTERGYVKYINRHGETEWITPEEAEKRKARRRMKKSSSHRSEKSRTVQNILINGGLIVFLLAIFLIVYRFNFPTGKKFGRLVVATDVAGAHIYLNGTLLNTFTPDTLKKVPVGRHSVVVFKEGFYAVPPVQVVNVRNRETSLVQFKLKGIAHLSAVRVRANMPRFRVFVDGIPRELENDLLHLPVGYHTIIVFKKGFLTRPPYQRVLVKAGDTLGVHFNFMKDSRLSYFRVSSNLMDGAVYLDEQFTGFLARGDLIPVPAGTYEVRVRKNGFQCQPDSQFINILPGEVQDLIFYLRPDTTRNLAELQVNPPGVTVVVDGEYTPWVAPLLKVPLSAGTHFVNFMQENRQLFPQDRLIYVSPGAKNVFRF